MENLFKNTDSNKRYYTLDYFYKQKFHRKVSKISLNGGFTCPNKDGTKGIGGCIYCSKAGSGDFAGNIKEDVIKQFDNIKKVMDNKWDNSLYIGYFQANTNTYAPVDILKEKYEPIIKIKDVVGLNIATRPDAISDECLDYLEDLNKRTFLTVELGLQTIHEKTARLINRGHDLDCFNEMVKKLRKRNINVVVHIMNGLPYETKEMMIETIRYINKLDIQGLKIHMLHIIKDTALAKMYLDKPFKVLSKEEYIDIVCDQLEILNSNIVLHRITGDPKKEDLIAPNWLVKKFGVLNEIDKELQRRNTYQGFQSSIMNRVRERLSYYLKPNSLVIDATVGNGKDTLFISERVSTGKIFCFDIQKDAISNSKKLLGNKDNIIFYNENHNKMELVLSDYIGKISVIVFNLGYLPRGNRNITTKHNTTIQAIDQALKLIHNQGVILITVYPGHTEGMKEHNILNEYLKNKKATYYHNTDKKDAPYLIELTK